MDSVGASNRGLVVRGVALLAVSGVIAAACGDRSDDVEVGGEPDSSEPQAQLPEDFGLAQIIAGDDEGWLLGSEDPDGVGPFFMWRWVPGERAERLGEVPDGVGADGIGFEGGLALAGVLCADEDAPDDDWRYECEAAQALVVTVDEAGETVSSAILWEKQVNLEDAPGVAFIGTTSSSVWIRTDRTLFEVDSGGAVTQSIPASGGLECIVDGDLVAFVDVGHDQQIEGGDAGPSGSNVGSAGSEPNRLIEVRMFDGSGWADVADGSIEVRPADGVRCSDEGGQVFTYDGNGVVASWSPADGWTESPTPNEPPSNVAATDDNEGGTSFIQLPDGSISESTIEGYETTPLSLPVPSGTEEGPTSLTVDASDSIVVGCVGQLTGLVNGEVGDAGSTRPDRACAVAAR